MKVKVIFSSEGPEYDARYVPILRKSREISYSIEFEGRKITPFESRIRGPYLTLSSRFKVLYSPCIKDMVYSGNPFLRPAKK